MAEIRILIAEDILLHRRMVGRLLEPFGPCDTVNDGSEAVQSFQKAFMAHKPYTLVVLDIMMPNMTGQEALRTIRTFERANGVKAENSAKILMATAANDRNSVIEASKSRCDGYIIKPIQREKLWAKLAELGFQPKVPPPPPPVEKPTANSGENPAPAGDAEVAPAQS